MLKERKYVSESFFQWQKRTSFHSNVNVIIETNVNVTTNVESSSLYM